MEFSHSLERFCDNASKRPRSGYLRQEAGITIYPKNGGARSRKLRGWPRTESPRSTKLLDWTNNAVSLDEVERAVF